MDKCRQLKELIQDKNTYYVPGIYDCLGAKAAEKTGFQTASISGNAVAAAAFGLPDMGLITMSEVAEVSERIASAVAIPVIADADTGYGQPLNFMRTVREFERRGIAGIHVEDQISPKKCAYYGGSHEIVPLEVQLKKLKAGLEARENSCFCIIARTDAMVSYGLEETVRRANAYLEAGADAAFAVGCREPEELEQLARRVEGPLMVIINDNSRLNVFNCQDFADMGIKFVMYAATVRTLVLRQMTEALCALKQDGNTRAVLDRLASPADFQELTGLAAAQELEYRFS